MSCWGMQKPGQSAQQRAAEVKARVDAIRASLAAGRLKLAIDARGNINLPPGLGKDEDLADACILRGVAQTPEFRLALAKLGPAGVKTAARIGR